MILVNGGVCDYPETHRDQSWHRYGTAIAAAYAKELSGEVRPNPEGIILAFHSIIVDQSMAY